MPCDKSDNLMPLLQFSGGPGRKRCIFIIYRLIVFIFSCHFINGKNCPIYKSTFCIVIPYKIEVLLTKLQPGFLILYALLMNYYRLMGKALAVTLFRLKLPGDDFRIYTITLRRCDLL